jgi:Na+-driven multidrug efflux pump
MTQEPIEAPPPESSPSTSSEVIDDPANPEILPDAADDVEPPKEGNERLGSRPPLRTLFILSIGPLISQITGALYGVVNTIWVAKAVGEIGMSAVSFYLNFDGLARAFGFFLQVAASAEVSALIGEGLPDEAAQVFCDLLRISVLCGGLACGIFLPLAKPVVRWCQAPEATVQLGWRYICPNLIGAVIPCWFLFSLGCLQAEGRSWHFTIAQVTSMVLNMAVFAPFFLFVCKTGIAGVSYSMLLGEFLPAATVVFLFYRGKFDIKPNWRGLFRRPSRYSLTAAKTGLSQLVFQLSMCFPGTIVRKWIGESIDDAATFDNIMAAFNAFCRCWVLSIAPAMAVTIGYLPAASYAFGAKRFRRIVSLLGHAAWVAVLWAAITMIVTVGFPDLPCRIFANTEEYLYWGRLVVRWGNLTGIVLVFPMIITALLQSVQMGGLGTIYTFSSQCLPLPATVTLLYFTNKHDVARLFYAYPISQAVASLMAIPFTYKAVKEVWKRPDDRDMEGDEFKLGDIEKPLVIENTPVGEAVVSA